MNRWLMAVCLGWSWLSSAANAQMAFAVEPAVQQRLGLKMIPAESIHYSAEAEGAGAPVDLVPLLTLDAELVAAEAAFAASLANFDRTAALHADQDNASAAALESARAQMLSDRARRDAALRQMHLLGGDALVAMDHSSRQSLLDRLSRGTAVMLRADFSPGTSLPARPGVRIAGMDSSETPIVARVLGRTTSANPQRPGPGLLLLVESPGWLQPGRSVRVIASTTAVPTSGVLIPTLAVLHREGSLWCYVRTAGDRFERRRLSDATPLPEGFFVASDIHRGDAVVVQGAASLLAAEIANAAPAASDDSDD